MPSSYGLQDELEAFEEYMQLQLQLSSERIGEDVTPTVDPLLLFDGTLARRRSIDYGMMAPAPAVDGDCTPSDFAVRGIFINNIDAPEVE